MFPETFAIGYLSNSTARRICIFCREVAVRALSQRNETYEFSVFNVFNVTSPVSAERASNYGDLVFSTLSIILKARS